MQISGVIHQSSTGEEPGTWTVITVNEFPSSARKQYSDTNAPPPSLRDLSLLPIRDTSRTEFRTIHSRGKRRTRADTCWLDS